MRLWTAMPKRVYEETICKQGYYTCDASKSKELAQNYLFEQAYTWLANYMTETIGPAPAGVKFPVWAWFRLHNEESKPDLRWCEFRYDTEPMALLEIEVPETDIVLSDEVKWTCAQLNDAPWCDTEEELTWYYDNISVTLREKEIFKAESWLRIFDIENSEHVQATFWRLDAENIKKVWYYGK